MFIPTQPTSQSTGVYGALPVRWAGVSAVDGTTGYWKKVPVGSVYHRKVEAGHWQECLKVKNDGTTSDWRIHGFIRESVTLADFTDGGVASGTYAMPQTVPDKVHIRRTVLYNVVEAGSTATATVIVGISGGDTDAFMTGTPSIRGGMDVLDLGVPSAPAVVATATPLITVAEDSDFGSISSLSFDIDIEYVG